MNGTYMCILYKMVHARLNLKSSISEKKRFLKSQLYNRTKCKHKKKNLILKTNRIK